MYMRVWARGLGHFAGGAVGCLSREPTSFRDPGWDEVNSRLLAQQEGERTQRTGKSTVALNEPGKLNFIALMKTGSFGSSASGDRRIHRGSSKSHFALGTSGGG